MQEPLHDRIISKKCVIKGLYCILIYWTTKETWHILFVNFLVVNEYNAHLPFHYVKLNNGKLRCTEIIKTAELISDVSYQNVT